MDNADQGLIQKADPTDREKELVRIIEENPTISQTEIAALMGITRSSVSVNITNLMKKGIIKGRGYVLAKQSYPVVFGTANCDCIAYTKEAPVIDAEQVLSGPVDFKIAYAGFAKTVSEIFARFNFSPMPLLVVGSDHFGSEILREMRSNNIAVDDILVTDSAPTAMYFELFDRSSNRTLMHCINSDIRNCLTPQYLQSKHPILRNASFFVIEDAIPLDTVSYLITNYQGTPLYFLALIYSQVLDYRSSFKYFEMVGISQEMLEDLTGIAQTDGESDDQHIVSLAKAFLQNGPASILIPFSGRKLCYATRTDCYIISNETENLPNVTYDTCRMAVFSTFLYYKNTGTPLLDTLKNCVAAQVLSAESGEINKYAYYNISANNISKALKDCVFVIKNFNF